MSVNSRAAIILIFSNVIFIPCYAMSKARVKISYKPVKFDALPYWSKDNHLRAFKTFMRSCKPLIKAAGENKRVLSDTELALVGVCRAARRLQRENRRQKKKTTGAQAREFFETWFTPHRVIHNGPLSVLTGYYEPVIKGSRKRQGKYQTPIYARPPDLVNLVKEKDRASVGRRLTHARRTKTGLEPYPTRKQIEQGLLDGKNLELLYLADPVKAFFLHIQGSGRIKFEDGSSVRITYDGKNGRPYSSIGKYLIQKGVIGAKSMSLQALGKWLRADRERGRKVMWHNKSFIFFRELKGAEAAGARGVMDVQLTPGRSLAIDPRYHIMGLPIFVSAPGLRHVQGRHGFNRLMVGQDVGSAIKGPERGDIYFGSGTKAGRLAGVTKENGIFYVLLPNMVWSTVVTKPMLPKKSK